MPFVAFGLLFWLLLSAWTVWQARSAALAGQDTLATLAELDPTEADLDAVAADLEAARTELRGADSRLSRFWLIPWRPMPVIGRQFNSARALAHSARVVADATAVVVADAQAVVDARNEERPTTLATLEGSLAVLLAEIEAADLGPDEALVGPLVNARTDAVEKLAELAERADEGHVVVRGLRKFIDDGSYLLVAANLNEMQAGSGMPLSIGRIEASGGAFAVADFRSLDDVPFPDPVTPVDDDVAERWGFLVPGNDFRKLALTPRYRDYSGPMALEMWRKATGEELGGTLTLDPLALQALLAVVGPVEVDGQTFSADNVLQFVLIDQYAEFEDDRLTETDEEYIARSEQREDLLAQIAAQAFAEVAGGDWDPFELIDAMRPVAAGRHLLAYSLDPDIQSLWELVGVAGEVTSDEISVGMMNLGANKLDPYLAVAVDATSTSLGEAGHRIRLDIALTNTVPDGLSNYVLGPWEAIGHEAAGGYTGRLFVVAPGATTEMAFESGAGLAQPRLEVFGPDGPANIMVGRVDVPVGEIAHVAVTITLAPGQETLTLLPSARYPAVSWTFDGLTTDDAESRELSLGS